jgi:signal transduction histidine kinase
VVADALDIVRLEHKQLPVDIQPVDVREVLGRVERAVRSELDRKQLSLSHDEMDDHLLAAADAALLERILTVLLRNAVQYTEKGGLTIGCTAKGQRAVLTVADTGVGILQDRLVQIFARPKLGSLLHGKGISLYVARSLAKAMHGDVTLVSTGLQEGSTFAVVLPMTLSADVLLKPERA